VKLVYTFGVLKSQNPNSGPSLLSPLLLLPSGVSRNSWFGG
jgi:hypothetical protein